MKVIRWIFLITYFLGTAFFGKAQPKEYLLQKANVAYSDLEFYNAAKIYERYYRVDNTNYSIIYRLADCYWNMKNYDSARIWYNKIPIDSILSNPILTRRFAEVYAISGDYKQAAKIYSNLKNFHIREYGFIHRDLFLRDSADWTIRYLNINTQKYREFSPMLLGSSIIWSTNEPNRKNTGDINGWDAKGFIHLNFLPSQNDIRYNDFPLSKTTMKSVKEKKAKNISRTFSAADVAIRHKGYGFSGIQKISKPDNERVQNLKIIKKLQYNIGVLAP